MNQIMTSSASIESNNKIRVLIVDDSPLICKALKQALDLDPEIEVIGHALSGQEALKVLSSTPCDLCTLDVHMPGMNGLSVLKHIMIRFPKPTLMISAFTAEGSRITFDALRYGAVDFFQKPSQEKGKDLLSQTGILQTRVKRAAMVQVGAARYLRLKPVSPSISSGSDAGLSAKDFPKGIVIVNTSTGGYFALLSLLPNLTSCPKVPLIISLGTPERYLNAFKEYLKIYVSFKVLRGRDQEILESGKVYLISNEESASLEQSGDTMRLNLGPRADLKAQEGAIDLLLFSASEQFGPRTLSVFLSGDGDEGLTGAREVLRNGGKLFVQKPETCLVPDLPRKIVQEGNAEPHTLGELTSLISEWSGV